MQIHEIKRNTKNRKGKYIGRGGRRGKTSGKGTKGQNSRAGRKKRPELRDIIKKLPKRRGYRFASFQIKPAIINLDMIEKNYSNGETVTATSLREKGLINIYDGKTPQVKVLGKGELTKKISLSGITVSGSVKQAIEKAGGTIN